MKKLIIIVVLILLAAVAYEAHKGGALDLSRLAWWRTSEEPAPTQGAPEIARRLFSPLSSDVRGAETALAEWHQHVRERPNAEGYLRLYRELDAVRRERSMRTDSILRIKEQDIPTLHGDSTEKRRDFFLRNAERRWDDYVRENRPRIERMIHDLAPGGD